VTIIPLAPSLLTGSSGLPGGFGRAVLVTPPYLALLRAGFCLPPVLPRARCALTAPFHPYSPSRPSGASAEQARLRRRSVGREKRACAAEASEGREGGRYVFCATILRVAPTGSYPAHCPAEFGLSSHLRALRARRWAIVWPAAAGDELFSRRFPGRFRTARVSCTDCSAVSR